MYLRCHSEDQFRVGPHVFVKHSFVVGRETAKLAPSNVYLLNFFGERCTRLLATDMSARVHGVAFGHGSGIGMCVCALLLLLLL